MAVGTLGECLWNMYCYLFSVQLANFDATFVYHYENLIAKTDNALRYYYSNNKIHAKRCSSDHFNKTQSLSIAYYCV
jgi:hypothetical protein